MISSVFGLEYKVSIDIDLVKTNQVLNTFYPNKIDDPIKVNAKKDPTLNLKVKLQDKESLKVIEAEQVFVTLVNQDNINDRKSFLVPKKGPLYSFDLSSSALPAAAYQATLYIADKGLESLKYQFGTIVLDNDVPTPADDYVPKKEIFHAFRSEVKDPSPVIPILFSLLTLSPWALLYSFSSAVGVNFRIYVSSTKMVILSTFYLIFLAVSLLLFHTFWVKLNLFQFFGYAIPLWSITALLGRFTLVERAALRGTSSNE